MSLQIQKPIITVNWLNNNLDNPDLIILDCTIAKVRDKAKDNNNKRQIKNARFFDLKQVFSEKSAPFPNTVLSPEKFQEKAQELGITKKATIICYDTFGIYSAPRVWWMFQLMGFTNCAVLDGGFPEWNRNNYPTEIPSIKTYPKGDFQVNYQPEKLKFTKQVLQAIENKEILIADARSKGRFYGTAPEPRNDLKSGHIPNSVSLPFTEVLKDGKLKSEKELATIFKDYNTKKEIIFTCGSGITASILALSATIAGIKNTSVYDGSWTEWGSTKNLPIHL
ncbi:sulfurtransferase [uncultured Polaribacter sp.]|uniref:sulfurtransferase n=1 Tax=uncultured Polaribacter sp. TaxID=174711 RepID=UPI0026227427|nr:sulfurtransferase [uncultured Polaribacter sp.]